MSLATVSTAGVAFIDTLTVILVFLIFYPGLLSKISSNWQTFAAFIIEFQEPAAPISARTSRGPRHQILAVISILVTLIISAILIMMAAQSER